MLATLITVLDAAGLGLFAVTGASKAVGLGLGADTGFQISWAGGGPQAASKRFIHSGS